MEGTQCSWLPSSLGSAHPIISHRCSRWRETNMTNNTSTSLHCANLDVQLRINDSGDEIFNSPALSKQTEFVLTTVEVWVTQKDHREKGWRRVYLEIKFTLCISIPISEILVSLAKLMSTIQFMQLSRAKAGEKRKKTFPTPFRGEHGWEQWCRHYDALKLSPVPHSIIWILQRSS